LASTSKDLVVLQLKELSARFILTVNSLTFEACEWLVNVHHLFAKALRGENSHVSSSSHSFIYLVWKVSFDGAGIGFSYVDALPDLRGSTEVANWVNRTTSNARSDARATDSIADSAGVTALQRAKTNFVGLLGWAGRNQREGCSGNDGEKGRLHFDLEVRLKIEE
jgi:hypothetical protein